MIFAACGDNADDDILGSESSRPLIYVDGEIFLNPKLNLSMTIRPYGGLFVTIDSVKADNSKCDVLAAWCSAPGDLVYYVDLQESAEPSAYTSGDTVTVTVFTGDLTGVCSITLLDINIDSLTFLTPESESTDVNAGESIDFVWETVENAVWYAIAIYSYYDSAGGLWLRKTFRYSLDTTYKVSDSITAADIVYFDIYISPVVGPLPISTIGNWDGRVAAGRLYSWALFDRRTVYIDHVTGPSRSGFARLLKSGAGDESAGRIVDGVYKAFE
jgi:hypothetical protein